MVELSRLARTVRAWQAEILAWHVTDGCSNGPTEAVNLLIKKIKRIGHGFRTFANYRLRLLLHCGVRWQTDRTALTARSLTTLHDEEPFTTSQAALVIRTDFSDHEAWRAIGAAILQLTEEGFGARVEFVDDAAYRGVTKEQLLNLIPEGDERPFFLMIVDDVTVRLPEHPILVVDLRREPGHEFRAVPAAVQSIENNLSIANMDFAEFADAVDEDGIFRGF